MVFGWDKQMWMSNFKERKIPIKDRKKEGWILNGKWRYK